MSDTSRAYPRDVPVRYKLRHGPHGPLVVDHRTDGEAGYSMPLQEVINTLNRYELRKQQIRWYVEKYGEPRE